MSKFIDSPRLGVGARSYFFFLGGAGESCLMIARICGALVDDGFSLRYCL
jgi:hypothetical protein